MLPRIIFSLAALILSSTSVLAQKPSVLFVNIDDLNDWTEPLEGHPQAITPNLDRLADEGVVFSNAICPSPVCFPSRTAVFSGIHPSRSGAISNFNWGQSWRFYVGGSSSTTTIPKLFDSQGWKVFGAGKNFHGGNAPEFSNYFPQPKEPGKVSGTGYTAGPLGWGFADVPYEAMPDHQVVDWGIQQIQSTEKPIFLSLGIYKPHVKWYLPQSSFDRYPLDEFQLPPRTEGDLRDLPERLKLLAHNEAKFGQGYHEQLVEDGQEKAWARAYLASVTFADEQLGRLLEAWQNSPHGENGVIILWSDHGFMLGEKHGWGKFKPWYDSIHSNLIMAGPGIARGEVRSNAVSLLDIYPTLLAYLNLAEPPQDLDGNNLLPLLKEDDPEWNHPVVLSHEEDGIRYDVVLDNRYRLTQLITGEQELYDLREDPHEWNNLADSPEYQSIIERLSSHLTFSIPSTHTDAWREAENLPHQTSADHGRRGNFHYPRSNKQASAEKYLVAELREGPKSYIDFVWYAAPGSYELSATFGPVTENFEMLVKTGPVVNDAAQATADYPLSLTTPNGVKMTRSREPYTPITLGQAEVLQPGLQLLRFELRNTAESQKVALRIDQLRMRRAKAASP